MNKKMRSFTSLILFIFLLFLNPRVIANLVFTDSFLGGYNKYLWTVRPNYLEPISSNFGIGDNYSTNWNIIDSISTILPNDSIIRFTMRINTSPSDVIFSCKTNFKNDLNYYNDDDFRIYLHSDGTFSFDSFLDGGGWGSELFNWDITPGDHFIELTCINGTMTLKEDDTILHSVTPPGRNFAPSNHVYFGYKSGDSEFANYKLCDNNSCDEIPNTPTPTPSPTSTPTPTPTDTPTPTPTPAIPKKVIVIPGMGGSWNREAFLQCKPDNYSGNWTAWTINGESPYQPLIDTLKTAGYDPIPYYYDWRKPVTSLTSLLTAFIHSQASPAETIHLVGHSYGGLVARAYLENTKYESQLDKLLTIGSPHQGTVLAYPAWSAGEIWMDDIHIRLGATMLQIGCFIQNRWSPRQTFQNLLPSIQNVLPVFNYLTDRKSETTKSVTSMHAQNNWQPTVFASPFYGVMVGTLSGSGHQTLQGLKTNPPSRKDAQQGNWIDGKPASRIYGDGDGTVLLSSSRLEGAQNTELPLNHGDLVWSAGGIASILNFVNGTTSLQTFLAQKQSTQTIKATQQTTALLIVFDGASGFVTDEDGNKTYDSEGQITILDPDDTDYTLTVIPKNKWWQKRTYSIIVAQLFEDGGMKWKKYNRTTLFKKNFKIRFDRHHRREDILRDK